MSESHGTSGAAPAAGSAAGSAGRGHGSGDVRRGNEPGTDERSQRLLQGGAASRAWEDTATRETVRTESTGGPADSSSAATTTYNVPGAGAGTATGATAGSTASGASGGSRVSQPRRARLRVSHINPASVLRLALLFGLCMLVVLLVAVAALWFVLDAAGVFSSISDATSTITDNAQGGSVAWFSFGRVMLITAVLGVFNVIAFTLLSTVGALLYNLCSDFVGGVEVTLSER